MSSSLLHTIVDHICMLCTWTMSIYRRFTQSYLEDAVWYLDLESNGYRNDYAEEAFGVKIDVGRDAELQVFPAPRVTHVDEFASIGNEVSDVNTHEGDLLSSYDAMFGSGRPIVNID